MLDYQKLYGFMKDYICHYREMLDFETEKLSFVTADDVEALSTAIPKEQAFVMKTNSFESRRIDIMGDDKQKSYKQIIDEAPPEWKNRLSSQYRDFSKIVLQIKKNNDYCMEIVKKRLELLEHAKNGPAVTYDSRGTTNAASAQTTLDRDI